MTQLGPLVLLVFFLSNLPAQDHSYDIRHYDLQIEPNVGAKLVSLRADILIHNPQLDSAFVFGLNDNYNHVSVRSPLSKVKVERSPGWVTIILEKPCKDVKLTFDLKGRLGRSLGEHRSVVGDSTVFLLWSDRFYPIDFSDWATVRTTIALPVGYQAVAPGVLTDSLIHRAKVEYTFRADLPTVCFSVFADSRWIRSERTVNGISMQTLLCPRVQRYSDQILNTSSEILKFYSTIYCHYPFARFIFVSLDSTYARRAYPGFISYSPQYLEREFTTTGYDAHETALLWWCYTLRGSGQVGFQWTEGFGDYAEILYDEKFGKPIPKIFQYFRSEFLKLSTQEDAIYSELTGATPQKIIHGKFPWLMHILRYVVGDDAFKRAMSRLFDRFRFRTFTMAEFVSVLEEGCGKSLAWWRTQWLERKGVPELSMRSTIAERNGLYQISVRVEQKGNLYTLPLEIGIETAAGMRIERVRLDGRYQEYDLTSEVKPVAIVLDPHNWILMNKDVSQ
jgi:aminopeptidase N